MLINEKWIRWRARIELKSEYFITSISYDTEGFKIIMETDDNDRKLRVSFNCLVQTYRCIDELYTGKIFSFLHKKYSRDFLYRWPFFKVENSEYIKWFFEVSDGMAQGVKLKYKHFAIYTNDLLLDVICSGEPTAEFID